MDKYDGTVKAMIPFMKTHIPAQRLGSEAEVSSAICFLLSDAANYISGVQLNVDGAMPLGGRMWPIEPHEKIDIYNGFHRAVAPEVLRGKESE
jgi:citronellol/citronellal dehydrogenase